MALKECRVKDIACGESHCVAIDLDGQAYAWGIDEMGQLGAPKRHAADIAMPAVDRKPAATLPVTIAEQVSHLPVCVNPLAGCASVTPLSLGSELVISPPVTVKFTAIACGATFSLALDRSGCVWSWGGGEGGVLGLGIGGCVDRLMPARVEALIESPIASISCGSYHAMVLATTGELYSWGRAEGGQLGISEQRIQSYIEEKQLEDTCICDPLRVLFSGLLSDPAASGGDVAATLGETSGGASADAMNLRAAAAGCPPDADDPIKVKQVACGDVHSCALDATGQVWSWGWGEFGQLGLGFSSDSFELGQGGSSSKRLTPEVIDARHFDSMKIKSVACGGAFSAAIGDPGPMTPNYTGNLFLWGANEVGQCTLPPRKPSEVDVPTKAQGLVHTIIRSVACGASHVVAVDIGGRAYSWGSAQYGQLGASMPPKTFDPPPCLQRDASTGGTTGMAHQHQPTLIQSVSRLHIMKAACGLHHSLLVSEVSGESSVRGASQSGSNSGVGEASDPPSKALPDDEAAVAGTAVPAQGAIL